MKYVEAGDSDFKKDLTGPIPGAPVEVRQAVPHMVPHSLQRFQVEEYNGHDMKPAACLPHCPPGLKGRGDSMRSR